MPPTINTINPSQGPTTGGTTVTLTGTGMTGSTGVRFGSTNAPSFVVNSATQITTVSPPRAAGAAAVIVLHPTGNSNSVTFTYVVSQVPVVTGVSPSSGPTAGGTNVTLTGTGFTGASSVTFGGVPATSFTVNSATQITAVTPPAVSAPRWWPSRHREAPAPPTPSSSTPGSPSSPVPAPPRVRRPAVWWSP